MTRLTKDRGSLKHDDRIDVLAMSVEYWSSRTAVDPTRAVRLPYGLAQVGGTTIIGMVVVLIYVVYRFPVRPQRGRR